jgi:hypothetical protein
LLFRALNVSAKRILSYELTVRGFVWEFLWSNEFKLLQWYGHVRIQGNKVKSIPLQALTGPEVNRRLRLPDFKNNWYRNV